MHTFLIFHMASYYFIVIYAKQVSEEVERALAKLGPARLNGRYTRFLTLFELLISEFCWKILDCGTHSCSFSSFRLKLLLTTVKSIMIKIYKY